MLYWFLFSMDINLDLYPESTTSRKSYNDILLKRKSLLYFLLYTSQSSKSTPKFTFFSPGVLSDHKEKKNTAIMFARNYEGTVRDWRIVINCNRRTKNLNAAKANELNDPFLVTLALAKTWNRETNWSYIKACTSSRLWMGVCRWSLVPQPYNIWYENNHGTSPVPSFRNGGTNFLAYHIGISARKRVSKCINFGR